MYCTKAWKCIPCSQGKSKLWAWGSVYAGLEVQFQTWSQRWYCGKIYFVYALYTNIWTYSPDDSFWIWRWSPSSSLNWSPKWHFQAFVTFSQELWVWSIMVESYEVHDKAIVWDESNALYISYYDNTRHIRHIRTVTVIRIIHELLNSIWNNLRENCN